jgi:hypothetical protein
MANLLLTLFFPLIISVALLFSWQTKKRKVEQEKPPVRVTVFYNPSYMNKQETVSKKQPLLIRVPKI